MIYAVSEDLTLTLVAGDDGPTDFKSQIDAICENHETTVMPIFTMMMDAEYGAMMKLPPQIISFGDEVEMNDFIKSYDISVIPKSYAAFEFKKMIMIGDDDGRTIREVHNLDEHDPWDTRTEEEKAPKGAAQAKDKDKDSTDGSWGADKKPSSSIRVNGIKAHVDADGNVVIDEVVVTKGYSYLHNIITIEDGVAEDYENLLRDAGLRDYEQYSVVIEDCLTLSTHESGSSHQGLVEALERLEKPYTHTIEERGTEEEAEVNEDYLVAEDNMVEIYFRLDVPNQTADVMVDLLVENGMRPAFNSNTVDDKCWLAYVKKATAEDNKIILENNGYPCEIVAVDRLGNPILEEGANAIVVDTKADVIEPPFPWNDKADEFYALSEEEQQKSLTGKWLCFSIRDFGSAPYFRIIHITPISYFNKNKMIWDGDLPIEHLFKGVPIEKFGDKPYVYQCKAYDAATLNHLLSKGKMVDSIGLTNYVNSLQNGIQ